MHQLGQPREITDRLNVDAELKLNGTTVKILHTPGHTRDSLCLIFPDRIITGDALFLDDGGAGRADLPGGDPGSALGKLATHHGIAGTADGLSRA